MQFVAAVMKTAPEQAALHGDLINRFNGIHWNQLEIEIPVE
jgi:hypothetical protein